MTHPFWKNRISAAWAIGAAAGAFLLGAVWVKAEIWPYGVFKDAAAAVKFLRKTDFMRRFDIAQPIIHEGAGVVNHDQARAFAGPTLIAGIFTEGVSARLIDMDGSLIRQWPVEFNEIWPKPTHIHPEADIPTFRYGYQIHGIAAARDGSIVFNIENFGLVKMDRCGRVVWKVDRRTHHFVTPVGDGTFWVGAHRNPAEIDQALDWPGRDVWTRGHAHFSGEYEDTLLHVSADGAVIEEISVLAALLKAATWQELFQSAGSEGPSEDPTHFNDAEIVTPALAARIPGASAGDLLISIRNLQMLAVIDTDTGAMIWRHVGPWVGQHDPDILADGRISIFDNQDHKGWGYNREFGPSRIGVYAPDTNTYDVVFPKTDAGFFYTRVMGMHEHLPNGDVLVAETTQGRVIEAAPDGAIVWEFLAPFDESHAALIANAVRYAPDYFEVADWADCPAQ